MARKLVVVNDNVRLVEVGNIYGPISTPTRIPLETIRAMCVKNRDVWECDPVDPRNREKRVKLTLANYGETHFGIGEGAKKQVEPAPAPAPVEEKKDEAPVVETPEVPAEEPAEETVVTSEESVAEDNAPVQEEATKPQNPQNHNGKKNKKGR